MSLYQLENAPQEAPHLSHLKRKPSVTLRLPLSLLDWVVLPGLQLKKNQLTELMPHYYIIYFSFIRFHLNFVCFTCLQHKTRQNQNNKSCIENFFLSYFIHLLIFDIDSFTNIIDFFNFLLKEFY